MPVYVWIICVVVAGFLGWLIYSQVRRRRRPSRPATTCPLPYPTTAYQMPELPNGPKPGESLESRTQNCSLLYNILDESKTKEAKHRFHQNHHQIPNVGDCDLDCDDWFLQQLYESYLVKFLLEDPELTQKIISLYRRIYHHLGLDEEFVNGWVDEDSLYPVNQKGRDWTKYAKKYILQDLSGFYHDPTTVLMGADLLVEAKSKLSQDFAATRDYMFNNILKRVRGYRISRTDAPAEGIQVGNVRFDWEDLELDPRWYIQEAWVHPGRSRCLVNPLQGMYQHESARKFVPLECGISGSTNYWIWTALFSGVNMTLEETRLFLLSAFMVLNADGGHSLNEVLASAALTAIYWKEYLKYSKDRSLVPFIEGSNFAKHLYEVTKHVNPVGDQPFKKINYAEIANRIYNKGYPKHVNSTEPSEEEIELNQEIEAFYLWNRYQYQFGNYSTFLAHLPHAERAFDKVEAYVHEYCQG